MPAIFFLLYMSIIAVIPAAKSVFFPDLHLGWKIALFLTSITVFSYLWVHIHQMGYKNLPLPFFIVYMAIIIIIPATKSVILPDINVGWKIAIWIFSILAGAYFWVHISKRKKNQTIKNSIIGQVGILSRGSSPEKHGLLILQKPVKGMTEWTCVSDEEIEPNSHVVVVEKISHDVLRVASHS